MIKVMIVDDETTTRNGILKYVHWRDLGIDQIKALAGGEEALAVCASWHPDVVVSDIRMPDMDGITFGRRLREMGIDCSIIYISGYADKENLLAAFSLLAVSFVEKPIVLAELEKALSIAVAQCNRRTEISRLKVTLEDKRSVLEDAVVNDIYRGSITDKTLDNCRFLGVPIDQKVYYRPIVFQSEKPMESKAEFLREFGGDMVENFTVVSRIFGFRNEREICFILYGEDKKYFFDHLLRSNIDRIIKRGLEKDIPLFCVVGTAADKFQSLSCSLSHCRTKQEEELFFSNFGKCIFCQCGDGDGLRAGEAPDLTELVEAIGSYNMREVEKLETELFRRLKLSRVCSMHAVKKIYFRLLYQVDKSGNELYHKEESINGDDIWDEINKIVTIDSLHQYFLESAKKSLAPGQDREGMSDTVFSVCRMIKKEYAREELDISMLSEAVYLTPTYLSNLFKKETGYTIGQYITTVRIQEAKKLLTDKSLKLYQVAEACGYSDQNYFAKIFKKYVGINPSEYRKKKG